MSSRQVKLSFLAILIVAICAVMIWAWVPQKPNQSDCRLNKNAAWIDVDWLSKPIDEIAVRELADGAARRQIKYLFPYASYVKADGTFSQSFEYAGQFVSTVHRFNPNVLILAWVGVPLKNERPIGVKGSVDLTNQTTRQAITNFVATLMQKGHFDGVHLDVETVQNNDTAFLLLIDEIRIAIGAGRKISIASGHWVPDPINALPLVKDFRWSGEYYKRVAQQVDQIVAMTYDSYAPLPAIYRFWIREQSISIAQSLADTSTELLIGVSVSLEETRSHHRGVENLENG